MKSKFNQSLLITLLITLVSFYALKIPFIQTLENKTWDWRVSHLQNPKQHDSNIKLILIDQDSLDWAETNFQLSWPWPREIYAKMVDYCYAQGAKAVVMDILFQERSFYGVEDDNILALALKKKQSAGAFVISNTQGDLDRWPQRLLKPLYGTVDHQFPQQLRTSRASFPVDSIASSYALLGSVSSTPDRDGIIRKTYLLQSFDGRYVPTLALSACIAARDCGEARFYKNKYYVGNNEILPTADSKAIIKFHGPSQTYETFNAASIIHNQLLIDDNHTVPKRLNMKGSYVFIGVSAPGLMDLKSTPVENIFPGTEIHATILDNLLHHDFILEFPAYLIYPILFLSIWCVFFGTRIFGSLLLGVAVFSTFILLAVIGTTVAYYFHYWLPFVPFILGIIIAAFIAFSINYFYEGRQRRFIRNAFSRYISPQVIDQLIENPEKLKLGGTKETLTILFSDIEGFTTISTMMEPEQLAKFLNEYLGLVSDIILDSGGTIDKYEGDAIIAFWNAPLREERHAVLAVDAALKCIKTLENYASVFKIKYGVEVKTRFGIHTGEVVVGNLGTEKRFDYTFIGDAGNLASRLESANKFFGTYCMISEATFLQLEGSFSYRKIGNIKVIGRSESVTVYEPMLIMILDEMQIGCYNDALDQFYRGDLDVAFELFGALSDDHLSKSYIQIIQKVKLDKVKIENGVLILDEK